MTVPDSLPLHALTEDNLAAASPDLLRAMVKTFTDALMSAEADALCNAEYGQVSDERVNHRNGYRPREWDTRAGTVELAIPNCGREATSRPGCWNAAAGWRNSPSPSASPSCPSRRSARWPSTWTSRWQRSATGRWTPARTRSSGSTP
jgi:hypothetical protein